MAGKVLVVYGTRPEAIKVAPLIAELGRSEVLEVKTAVTGQHREMLDQVNELFGIVPDVDMDLFAPGQSLNTLAAKVIRGTDELLDHMSPDAVVVQGDTTTVAMVAIASFMRGVKVVHLEAGLRSHDILSPFPEEANRRLAGQVTALHLAPTTQARDNLVRENFNVDDIAVTGNTVIDALLEAAQKPVVFDDPRVAQVVESGEKILLLTVHRRENLGEPMAQIARAIADLARSYPSLQVVFPAHRNPKMRDVVFPILESLPNVTITEPLDYLQFVHLQKAAHIVLTDSGGVQEESPGLGKPVLVLRENTERPEAVQAGTARLIGTDTDRIVFEARRLLDDPAAYLEMAQATNPYGDGKASQRAVAAIAHLLGLGVRLPDFGAPVAP
ncbi:non-hydrolyzing UDP-N-acetylglucosamine 2-epimerase [Aestuariimicrobium sp. T2.26MG-19.2B]|uniref:non-hydrolyzing UDP-N-acetylglucosamine 2-epimerase n=1 Tax=Aestuariimicrobium sp. T2.26MG-19.2B TaxID=3040679 RepID=UPI00247799F0|nr:UDP-N-acetylglucosamine 2-epimerase (non-hydrolyzing) [Aestuariimicrobium sp. T2.26MG-19.2B]CAI9406302.1 UDP-N-acetylglucosamine 2-epimerase [Aestuariimicrobium sp. T2.26MG-19.2B]